MFDLDKIKYVTVPGKAKIELTDFLKELRISNLKTKNENDREPLNFRSPEELLQWFARQPGCSAGALWYLDKNTLLTDKFEPSYKYPESFRNTKILNWGKEWVKKYATGQNVSKQRTDFIQSGDHSLILLPIADQYLALLVFQNTNVDPSTYLNQLVDFTELVLHQQINNLELEYTLREVREIVELLPQMIWETDPRLRVIYLNEYFMHRLGYSKEDIASGMQITRVFRREDRPEILKMLTRVTMGLKRPPKEVWAIKKSGALIPVRVYTNPVINDGVVTGITGTMVDMTDRIVQERELGKTQERLELALKASRAGMWDWDLKKDEVFRNEQWFRMFGYQKHDLPANFKTIQHLIHPEDKQRVSTALEQHLSNKTNIYQQEYRIKTKQGKWKWILDIGQVSERDQSGNPTRMSGIHMDIEERKRQERKLLKQQQSLERSIQFQRYISEITSIFTTNAPFDDQIRNALNRAGEITGVSRSYVFIDSYDGQTTSNLYEWCAPGISPQIDNLQGVSYENIPSWKPLLQKNGIIKTSNIDELPDDLIRVLKPQNIKALIIFPLVAAGKNTGFIGFDDCKRNRKWSDEVESLLRAISSMVSNAFERQKYNEQLLESESKKGAILTSLPEALIHLDITGTIMGVSGTTGPLFDALGRSLQPGDLISEILKKSEAKKLHDSLHRCLDSGTDQLTLELKNNGSSYYFEARLSRKNEREAIVLLADITKQKTTEIQLQEARQKAEEASKAKSEFLASMSHELRTPLNAILGFGESMIHKTNDAVLKKMAGNIISSGNHLLNLLNDILDMARIESGRNFLDIHPLDLRYQIDEVAAIFKKQAKDKGLKIRTKIDPNLPQYLSLDEIHFRHILVNLTGNAVKFTEKGSITIEATYKARKKSGDLFVRVTDTGIGMDADTVSRIFDMFHQPNQAISRTYGGIGLGLAIVKRLVEQMNGSISAESEPGKGSTFTVHLRDVAASDYQHNDKPEKLLTVKPDEKLLFKDLHILIVDDVQANIDTLKSLLDYPGLNFTEARNGEIALEIVKHLKPDLIILDMRLPGISGIEVARRVSEMEELKNTILVAATASALSDQQKAIRDSGLFRKVLFKPLRKEQLISMLLEFFPSKSELITDKKSSKAARANKPVKVKKREELTDKVTNELMPEWRKLGNKMVLNNISRFCEMTLEQGRKHDCRPMIEWAEDILSDIDSFDLDSAAEKLKRFPQIASTCTGQKNKSNQS